MGQTERIQRSAEVIQRLGPPRLAELAANVADGALSFEGGMKGVAATEPVHAAIRAFTAELRTFKA